MTKEESKSLLITGSDIKPARIEFTHDQKVRHQNMLTKGKGRIGGGAVTANQSKAATGPTPFSGKPSLAAKSVTSKVNFGQLGNNLAKNITNSLNKAP